MHRIVIKPQDECFYTRLEKAGFPLLTTSHLLPGKDLKDKLYLWCQKNWPTMPEVSKQLIEITRISEEEGFTVHNKIARSALEGVVEFAVAEKSTIAHLASVFDGDLTVDGTPVPRFSNTLGTLSFAERQKLLAQHLSRREEVK